MSEILEDVLNELRLSGVFTAAKKVEIIIAPQIEPPPFIAPIEQNIMAPEVTSAPAYENIEDTDIEGEVDHSVKIPEILQNISNRMTSIENMMQSLAQEVSLLRHAISYLVDMNVENEENDDIIEQEEIVEDPMIEEVVNEEDSIAEDTESSS